MLPILTKQCLGCHGGLQQKGGLDLRTIPLMLKGGESGPSIKSGQPADSELWKKIASGEMPPHEKKLSAVRCPLCFPTWGTEPPSFEPSNSDRSMIYGVKQHFQIAFTESADLNHLRLLTHQTKCR